MNEIMINQHMHVDYVLNTKFETKFFDAYIGTGNTSRPPYLEELFFEILHMEALFALENELHYDTHYIERTEWDHLYEEVMQRNLDSAGAVLVMAYGKDQYPKLFDTTYNLLDRKVLSFLTHGDTHHVERATLVNAPGVQVW